MSKNTNRKSERVTERPFKVPHIKTPRTYSVKPENGAEIKISGKDADFITDFKATLSNNYNIIHESRIFFDIDRKEYHAYVTVQHYQRSS